MAGISPGQQPAAKVAGRLFGILASDAFPHQEADIYVIGAPFYNFAIPSTLKAYLDHATRPGITFRYNTQGQPEGLLTGKTAYIATASSGIYSAGPFRSFIAIA